VIVIVALAAIVKFALGWLRGGAFKGMDRGLSSGFSGLVDLQVTLGIIYLVWDGFASTGFPMFRIQHGITMVIAAFVGHLSARWKNADDKTRFRNSLFVMIAVLAIIFVGVAQLPGG
jgi:hypothetical protein